MSNEQITEVGPSAADNPGNGHGLDDEGPLDPSVFFGLFDDLADDPEVATGPDPDAGPVSPAIVDTVAAVDVSDTVATEELTFEASEVAPEPADTAELHEPADVIEDALSGPLTDPFNGGGMRTDGLAIEQIPGDGRAAPETDPGETDQPDAILPTVSWSSVAPDELASNGHGMHVASPPPVPSQASGVDTTGPADRSGVSEPRPTLDPLPRPAEPVREGGGTLAKGALATIAIGLFAGLIVAFVLSLRSPDTAMNGSVASRVDDRTPAGPNAADEPPAGLAASLATGTRPSPELLIDHFTAALPDAITGRVDMTSLRFEPGTTELDERSAAIVAGLGSLLADQPSAPVTVAVRTYTEPTAAGNLALSSRQADALAASLVAAGAAPDQIRVLGLGAAPLSRSQPVPNFVALTPQFGDRRLNEVLTQQSPFALGVPTTIFDDSWPLRPDGLLAISGIAETLAGDPGATVGAAGYSFFPASETGIRAEADTAAAELTDFLVTAYDVDPAQVTTITPGSAVFVPTPEHGNHIWIQVGPDSQDSFDVASVDPASITFESGSAELDDAGAATVSALADILTTAGAAVVVDVRSYEAADDAANIALSEARRNALTEALVTAGVDLRQLRVYASGASSYLLDDQGSAITITVVP